MIRFTIINGKPFVEAEWVRLDGFEQIAIQELASFGRQCFEDVANDIDALIENDVNNWDMSITDFGFNKRILR